MAFLPARRCLKMLPMCEDWQEGRQFTALPAILKRMNAEASANSNMSSSKRGVFLKSAPSRCLHSLRSRQLFANRLAAAEVMRRVPERMHLGIESWAMKLE